MVTTSTQAGIASSSAVLAHCGVSYALGPVNESSVGRVAMRSEGGFDFVLGVLGAADLPLSLFHASAFHEGAAIGYEWSEGLDGTPVQLANTIYRDFLAELHRGGTYSWVVGFLLGGLSALAEEDRQLAFVGMAHLCFLVAHTPDRSSPAFFRLLHEVGHLHNAVLRVYRGRVQALKERGTAIEEAWRAALVVGCGSNGKPYVL